MKWQLWTQKRQKVSRALTMALLTVLSGITCISCSNNKDVLVTEIGVSPPNPRTSRTTKAGEFYIQGQTQHLRGNSQAAIAAYSKSISLNPRYAPAFKSRGLAYFDIGNKQGAIADYNEAVRLAPNYAEAYNNRANARATQGDRNGAIDDYNEAIRLDPKYAIAYNNRGNAYYAKGDKQKAIADYNDAIRLNPSFGPAFNNRGNARAALGDKRGALQDLQRAAVIFEKENNKDLYQQVNKNIQELGQ